jgi:hypothetical protein
MSTLNGVCFSGMHDDLSSSKRIGNLEPLHVYNVIHDGERKLIILKGWKELLFFEESCFITYMDEDPGTEWLEEHGYHILEDITDKTTLLFWCSERRE